MSKIDFYQIIDGQTGAQVAAGLQNNFLALESVIAESAAMPISLDPNSGIINSEAQYNAIIPESYKTEYPWDSTIQDILPWLWINVKKPLIAGVKVCIRKDNAFCIFKNIPENVGTVSEDGTVITLKALNNYFSFEIKNDLGVPEGNIAGAYQVYVLDENGAVIQSLHFAL